MIRRCSSDSTVDALHHARRVLLAGGAGHRRRRRDTARAARAEFALHPPAAGFGAEDFYPDLPDRAAVLTCRLAWNHPLPAGNKRATWASLVVFMDPNGGRWDPDPPDTDEAEEAMLAVAASEVDEVWFAQWLAARVRFDG